MSEPKYKPVRRLTRILDSIAQRKAALRPRTKWELKTSSEPDAFEGSLCQICQKLQAQSQAPKSGFGSGLETIYTTSSILATTSEKGCLICRILELAVKAYATNLRGLGIRDEHRIRLRDFDRDHKVGITWQRNSPLEIRVDIEVRGLDFHDRRSGSHDLEVYTLTGRLKLPPVQHHNDSFLTDSSFSTLGENELSSIFGIGRHVSEKLDLNLCLGFLQAQLKGCTSHQFCEPKELQRLPRRILQVRDGIVKLVDRRRKRSRRRAIRHFELLLG